MCLIALHATKLALTSAQLSDVYHANGDGLGCMWVNGTDVVIHRIVPRDAAHAERWYTRLLQAARVQAATEIVWHWRFATHGSVKVENTHPFRLSAGRGLVHNGVIHGYGHDDVSDTRHFAAVHLEGEGRRIKWPTVERLSRGSRLCVMDAQSGVMTTGEWETVWAPDVDGDEGEVHVSNTYWDLSKRVRWVDRDVALSVAGERWEDDDLTLDAEWARAYLRRGV